MHSQMIPVNRVPPRVSLGDGLGDVAVNGLLASHREHAGGDALPRHEHAAAYICVVLAGGYEQSSDGDIVCRRGTVVTHPAGHLHANRFGPEVTRCINLYFDASWMEDVLLAELFADYGHVQLDPRDETLIRLEREIGSHVAGSKLMVASAALDLAARASRYAPGDASPAWLNVVCEAIRHDLARAPDLMTLAAQAGVHPAHLCRAFRASTGETVGGYSRRLRLERAEDMLLGPQSLAEIAAATGFYDQAHLTRCFRRRYGVSPGTRRAQIAS